MFKSIVVAKASVLLSNHYFGTTTTSESLATTVQCALVNLDVVASGFTSYPVVIALFTKD